MKQIILFFCLIFICVSLKGEEMRKRLKKKEAFNYFSLLGDPVVEKKEFFLGAGIGYRLQKNYIGLDLPLEISRAFNSTKKNELLLKISPSFLLFFFPNTASEYYLGNGISMNSYFSKDLDSQPFYNEIISLGKKLFVVPHLVAGKKFQRGKLENHFYEFKVESPSFDLSFLKKKKGYQKFHYQLRYAIGF